MLATKVRDYLKQTPFVPFTIHLNDGQKIKIPQRGFAHVSPKNSSVLIYNAADGARVLSSSLIAAVAPTQRRGTRKKP